MTTSTERSNLGCVIAILLFPVIVVAGLVIGTVLRDDDTGGERSVTVDGGSLDGTEWRVDAHRDVEGDTCAFLFADGEQLTGACDATPQDATFGASTVVFGKAPGHVEEVRVELDTGDVVSIATTEVDEIDGRFYVQVVDGDIDAVGLAEP
jgi:hypothetical protein